MQMTATKLMPYKIAACGLSDIGQVRQNNEDVWAQMPQRGFFILADGMGGHQAGEIAAQELVSMLCRIVKRKFGSSTAGQPLPEVKDLLLRAIRYVNAMIYRMGKSQPELKGMGTTLCCLLFHPEGIIFAHVGDSRIYRYRHQQLEQLTKDHSLLYELIEQGQLDEQQAGTFLYRNIITKAIGTEAKVAPSVACDTILVDDLYLMCSDGLTDLLLPNEIAAILEEAPSIQIAAEMLVLSANQRGGRDNITVVITKVIEGDVPSDLP